LNKEKINWSNDLKLATTAIKAKVHKVRVEPIQLNHRHSRLGT